MYIQGKRVLVKETSDIYDSTSAHDYTNNITVILKTIEFILISLNVNTDGCFYGLAALIFPPLNRKIFHLLVSFFFAAHCILNFML